MTFFIALPRKSPSVESKFNLIVKTNSKNQPAETNFKRNCFSLQ